MAGIVPHHIEVELAFRQPPMVQVGHQYYQSGPLLPRFLDQPTGILDRNSPAHEYWRSLDDSYSDSGEVGNPYRSKTHTS